MTADFLEDRPEKTANLSARIEQTSDGVPRKETLMGTFGESRRPIHAHRPATDIQALMEAAPGDEPEESTEAYQERLEQGELLGKQILGAIAALEDPGRLALTFVLEGMSSSEAADALHDAGYPRWSRQYVHRIARAARDELQSKLQGLPLVLEHLDIDI